MMKWTILSTLLWLTLTGCVTQRLENSLTLVQENPKGFRDAVNASPEATEFVRKALKTINSLEEQLESR